MVRADLKNIFRKNLIGIFFLELENVCDPLILTAFYKGNLTQNQSKSKGFRAREIFSDEIFFRKNIF